MGRIGFKFIPRLIFDTSDNSEKEVFVPMVTFRLSAGHGQISQEIDGIVDSGSDRNLLPMSLAQILKIDFKKSKPKIIMGIGHSEIEVYSAKVNIWINGRKYATEADFTAAQNMALLGRQGFFNLFDEVIFNEGARFVYLETNSKS